VGVVLHTFGSLVRIVARAEPIDRPWVWAVFGAEGFWPIGAAIIIAIPGCDERGR
jgi:hypothetical protein